MRPQVGVGVFIMNKEMDKFLMSARKDCGKIALMGGHLERYEQINECGQRESLEESNLQIPIQDFREYPQTFNVIEESVGYHYVTFFTVAKCPQDQTILNTEPEKHGDWEWYDEHMFIQAYKEKKIYYSVEMLFKTCNEDFNVLLQTIQNLYK